MSELRDFLRAVDDDYLIGISNRGILKRSYKDLEKEQVMLAEAEQVAAVAKDADVLIGRVNDAVVTLKLPLAGSICSCPAYGVCKHIVMMILAMKKQIDAEDEESPGGSVGGDADEGGEGTAGNGEGEEAENTEDIVADIVKYPLEALQKAVSEKEFRSIVQELRMQDKTTNTTVKLTVPLEYSTCSCHSNGLCRHRVKAILALKLANGIVTMEQLDSICGVAVWKERDLEQVKTVLASVRVLLTDMLMAGGARLAAETVGTLERQAIQCHNAGLAILENRLRALSDMVSGYQGRRVSVTAAHILQGMTEVHCLLEQLEYAVQNGRDISFLAGEFRSEYRDIPDLYLSGMGMRHFVSATGYEGETIYFIEENTNEWYTYTVARPTFYEGRRKKGNFGHETPWSLPCTLYQLAESRILLSQGKANAEHRLSSTSQAKAQLLGRSDLRGGILSKNIYYDFARLWEEYLRRLMKHGVQGAYGGSAASTSSDTDPYAGNGGLYETEKLFLIQPRRILDMRYDETTQRLVFFLEDGAGRRLRSQLTYSKQESAAIESLEKMQRELEKNLGEVPVFLGILYVEDGECVLYPIEALTR